MVTLLFYKLLRDLLKDTQFYEEVLKAYPLNKKAKRILISSELSRKLTHNQSGGGSKGSSKSINSIAYGSKSRPTKE